MNYAGRRLGVRKSNFDWGRNKRNRKADRELIFRVGWIVVIVIKADWLVIIMQEGEGLRMAHLVNNAFEY